jgi:hypothetical protein
MEKRRERNMENTLFHLLPLESGSLYPFSKDIQKYKLLTETLTYYRLTFGQPRQEELIETLFQSGLTSEEIQKLRKHILIDLSP